MQRIRVMAGTSASPRFSRSSTAYLMLAATSFIWAGNVIAAKVAVAEITPITLTYVRSAIATLVMLPFFLHRKEEGKVPKVRELPVVFGLGLTGVVSNVVWNLGLKLTRASDAAVISGMSPIFTALLASATLSERLTAGRISGTVTSLVGVGLIFGQAPFTGNRGGLAGDLMIASSSLAWSVYTILARRFAGKFSALSTTVHSYLFGTLLLTPLGVIDEPWAQLLSASGVTWAAMLYGAFFGAPLAFILWLKGVARIGATNAGIFGNLTLAMAVVLSHLTLGEVLGFAQVAGVSLVIVGIWLVNRA